MVDTKTPTRWSAEEIETLRRLYPARSAKSIAAQLGRPVEGTYKKIEALGLVVHKRIKVDAAFHERIRVLNAAGYSDPEIASRIGCARITVANHRRKLGLPDNQHNERHQAKVQAKVQAALRRQGLVNLAGYRTQANQRYAEQSGWPNDLPPTSVAILNALETFGPLTRKEMCEAIGSNWLGPKHSLQSNRHKGNYLTVLVRRGLVVPLARIGCGETSSSHCWVYSLSMTAERRFPDVAG